MEMLKESDKLTSESKYHKCFYYFVKDDRFRVLEDHERENLFQDYMDELVVTERGIEN